LRIEAPTADHFAMPDLSLIWSIVELALKDRGQLALQNAALRHQLAVLKRSVKRARIQDSDRIFWMLLRRSLKDWKEALILVKPETVVRGHRRGFRHYWKRKSRSKPGQPPISMAIIMLIKRLSRENETWGAPRITDELALLGHEVAEATVAKYMVRHRRTGPPQTWRTFIQNHLHEMAACDFFTVPTATFRVLYCLVVLSLDRRRIVHVNVTDHPTAARTARQLLEAFPGGAAPRFLMRDRDGNYGWEVARVIRSLDITEVISARRSPWQNPFVERVGSIRRECTDHVIPMGESYLRRVLNEYVAYHNESRTHQSLDGNAPEPRCVQSVGHVIAEPVLGGLHHRYSRAA
jgi:transposase InsO family protein